VLTLRPGFQGEEPAELHPCGGGHAEARVGLRHVVVRRARHRRRLQEEKRDNTVLF